MLVMISLTFCDVRFQTTHVQSLMNSTAYPLQAWIQTQSEKTRIRLLHEQLCSKVGGDVLEQLEVLKNSSYNVSVISSTLQSLEKERKSLLAERDELLKKLSAQENINAELQRANVTCHGNLNTSMYQRERLVKEALNMSTQVKILNGTVKELNELKDHVAAITNAKNDCDASLTRVNLQLSNCKNARDTEEAKTAKSSRNCWV